MYIAILAGSFNPPHHGHLKISEHAGNFLNCDQIWWLVTPLNPMKELSVDYQDKLQNCQDFTAKTGIKVKDFEAKYNLKYSFETISLLKKKYPNYKFFFVIGADNLAILHKWRKYDKIAKNINFLVYDRGNNMHKILRSRFALKYRKYKCNSHFRSMLKTKNPPYWQYVNLRKINISSSLLRLNNVI